MSVLRLERILVRLSSLLVVALVGVSTSRAQDAELPRLDPNQRIHHYVHHVWTMEDLLSYRVPPGQSASGGCAP